jgi:hypothetical protein
MLVEERGWMTADELNDAYALCHSCPAPTSSTCRSFGRRIRKVGAAVALVGLIGPPFVIVTLLGFIYARVARLRRSSACCLAISGGGRIDHGHLRQDGGSPFKDRRRGPAGGARDLRIGRRLALAALLGPCRAGAAERRDRVGVAMKEDGGTL